MENAEEPFISTRHNLFFSPCRVSECEREGEQRLSIGVHTFEVNLQMSPDCLL